MANDGDHADARDHGGLAGHFRECRTRDDFQHHEDGMSRQRQDGDAGEHARHATVVADFGGRFLRVRGSWGAILRRLVPAPPGPGGNR